MDTFLEGQQLRDVFFKTENAECFSRIYHNVKSSTVLLRAHYLSVKCLDHACLSQTDLIR